MDKYYLYKELSSEKNLDFANRNREIYYICNISNNKQQFIHSHKTLDELAEEASNIITNPAAHTYEVLFETP